MQQGKMSREHHKIPQKIFSDLQIWKIMGAAMGDHNVLHHKQIICNIKRFNRPVCKLSG